MSASTPITDEDMYNMCEIAEQEYQDSLLMDRAEEEMLYEVPTQIVVEEAAPAPVSDADCIAAIEEAEMQLFVDLRQLALLSRPSSTMLFPFTLLELRHLARNYRDELKDMKFATPQRRAINALVKMIMINRSIYAATVNVRGLIRRMLVDEVNDEVEKSVDFLDMIAHMRLFCEKYSIEIA